MKNTMFAYVLTALLATPAAFAMEAVAVPATAKDNATNYSLTVKLRDTQKENTTLKDVVTDLQKQLEEAKANSCKPAVVASSASSSGGCQYDAVTCTFYSQVTGGLPEAAGAAFWQGKQAEIKAANPGMTDDQIIATMKSQAALLPEVVAHTATGSVDSGRASVNSSGVVSASPDANTYIAGTNTSNQLESLYQNVLGRGSDAGGMAYWQSQINSGAMSIQDVQNYIVNCSSAGTCQ